MQRAEGEESRRKVAEWAAAGWQQPADWGSCLDWVVEQWGAVEGEGPLQDLLGQLQFGNRVRLVGVLLWRQWQFSSAARGWRRQQYSQEEDERAAGRWGDVRALFQQLTWRWARSSRGFVSLHGQAERAERQEVGGF